MKHNGFGSLLVVLIDVEILYWLREQVVSLTAASWVFQKRAIGFPSRLPIERAHHRVIKDRIGGTLGEQGENGTLARAYTLVEYLIGRNNYRRAAVYTSLYGWGTHTHTHILCYATEADNIAGTIGRPAK